MDGHFTFATWDAASQHVADKVVKQFAGYFTDAEVDAARVGQVLENLVANALKYAPGDSPVVVGAGVDGEWLVGDDIGRPFAEETGRSRDHGRFSRELH